MRRRRVESFEQPHMLRRGLQSAVLAMTPTGSPMPAARTAENPVPSAGQARRIPVPVGMGVPHGVRSAIVYADDVRVDYCDGQPDVYFCNSRNFRVLADSVIDGDDGTYPPQDESVISASCAMPRAGFHSVRMRVSVNGSIAVHIEQIGAKAAREADQLVPVGV